jgi:NitT/TauT family transport system permease protein
MFVLSGVPALSWMLLAVLWFPSTEARIFFVLFVVMFPFYALNAYEGIRALPRDWVEMLDVFRPTRRQLLRMLIVPQLIPYVLLTTKSVSGYAIRMVVFAELIGAATGAGARLAQAQGMLRVDRVFAWTILLVIVNFMVQGLVSAVDRRLLAWRPAVEIR